MLLHSYEFSHFKSFSKHVKKARYFRPLDFSFKAHGGAPVQSIVIFFEFKVFAYIG